MIIEDLGVFIILLGCVYCEMALIVNVSISEPRWKCTHMHMSCFDNATSCDNSGQLSPHLPAPSDGPPHPPPHRAGVSEGYWANHLEEASSQREAAEQS